MQLFQKRETLVQNIAYMAIMAAINVIFVLLTAILPPLMFLIIFVLPLTSTVVTLFCKKRYFPIYFVVTIGLCLLTTSAIYIYDTFFYVLPSMITGFIFGLLIEKRAPAIYVISISSIVQYIITFLTFIILDAMLPNMNFIDALLNIFGLANFQFKEVFAHVFLYFLSAAQTAFTYAFLRSEVKKLGFEFNLEVKIFYLLPIFTILCLVLSISLMYVYQPLSYIFILISFPIVIYQIIFLLFEKNNFIYAFLVISVFVGALLFALCYPLVPRPMSIVLLSPYLFLNTLIYFLHNLFLIKNKKM